MFRPWQPWVQICTQLSLSQPSLSYQLSFVSLSALSQLPLISLSLYQNSENTLSVSRSLALFLTFYKGKHSPILDFLQIITK